MIMIVKIEMTAVWENIMFQLITIVQQPNIITDNTPQSSRHTARNWLFLSDSASIIELPREFASDI